MTFQAERMKKQWEKLQKIKLIILIFVLYYWAVFSSFLENLRKFYTTFVHCYKGAYITLLLYWISINDTLG